jgi:5'-methylthioadenosine phosphorylase
MRAMQNQQVEQVPLAVIGGSGLYELEGARKLEELDIPTPFGLPSDRIALVEMGGVRAAFLPRHGRGHRLLPGEVPSRANIWALKSLGVEQIISVSAVGSLAEDCRPGHFVLCDQLIDRTRGRERSFFGEGAVGHVSFAEPYCAGMREVLARVLSASGHPFHGSGTLVCMEGPAFSTRAESHLHRGWNAHLIGMTSLPEARLAREAEMCLAIVAMITDYDCWREAEEGVTMGMVLATMRENTRSLQALLPQMLSALGARGDCPCRSAASHALVTDPAHIPYETRRKLDLLYGKYWNK